MTCESRGKHLFLHMTLSLCFICERGSLGSFFISWSMHSCLYSIIHWLLLYVPLCAEIPLTASSTTSTTRSICWTWNTVRQTHMGKVYWCWQTQVHTANKSLLLTTPQTQIYWSTFKQGLHVNIHKRQCRETLTGKQALTDSITLSFLQLRLSGIDFLNATRCLRSCSTTYMMYWQRHSRVVGFHKKNKDREKWNIEWVLDR